MRIGITCYPTYGGSGVVATELGIELAALGHEVHFISYSQPFRLSGRDEASFITRFRSRVIRSSSFRRTIWRWPRAWPRWPSIYGLDLLHVHYAIPHSVSALLARQMLASAAAGCPLSPRCTAPTSRWWDLTAAICRSPLRHPGKRRRHQHLQLPARKDHRGASTSRGPLRPSRTSSTAMSIRPSMTRRKGARARLAPDEPILMHLSNFRPVKRVTDVVKIFARVAAAAPGATGAGGRRAGPLGGRVAGARPRHSKRACTSWASRSA
jgi:glycosyltransferase involved in cell wall biosynthesis